MDPLIWPNTAASNALKLVYKCCLNVLSNMAIFQDISVTPKERMCVYIYVYTSTLHTHTHIDISVCVYYNVLIAPDILIYLMYCTLEKHYF